jgi:methionyl-tRNA formyltransferase
MSIGLLVSGVLGLEALKLVTNHSKPVFVFTNKTSTAIIEYCLVTNIPVFIGNPRNSSASEFLVDKHVELILSINYLFLIEKDVVNFPSKYCINIHGSLLPKYRGRTPHVWSIINNEKYTGVTAHLIDENCDTGAIVKQERIEISFNDTGASLLEKYSQVYLKMLTYLLNEVESDNLTAESQDESKATYFHKRTPDDGEINWGWQKERIRNWVRAQANPYPGAFTVLNDQRVIIDEIVYSDMGFKQDFPNGMVLGTSPVLVKTQNGVVELSKIREGKNLIVKGMVL